MRNVPEMWFKSLIWGSSSGSCFSSNQLSRFFFHIWPALEPSQYVCTSFCQDGFQHRGSKEYDHIYYEMMPPTFLTPRGAFLHICSRGGFLDLRSNRCGRLISLLQQISDPAINFVLGVSGKTKLQFTPLDKLQLLSPGAHLPPTSTPS